jgi:hypothetical protein
VALPGESVAWCLKAEPVLLVNGFVKASA